MDQALIVQIDRINLTVRVQLIVGANSLRILSEDDLYSCNEIARNRGISH